MIATDTTPSVYVDAITGDFAFLKGAESIADLHARAIVLPDGAGLLVPICALHTEDASLVADLAAWRQANTAAFPSRTPITTESTARWLRDSILAAPDRILFLILDRTGRRVGHIGLGGCLSGDREMEIENVVRGVTDVAPGLMSAALETLCVWAKDNFAPNRLHLRVLEDNTHALGFYTRLGWQQTGSEPLSWTDGGLAPTPDGADPDSSLVCMDLQPEGEWDGTRQILTAGPLITARETTYALDAVRNGWNARHSEYLDELQVTFGAYVGAKHALATSSCTGALHLAMLALGIGPGDEVIVPETTWVATASVVRYVGAIPVFADVEPDSWCLDPDSVRQLITARTKAIMPVHIYGHPTDMDAILELADQHGLLVVEDAAPGIGSLVRGRQVGAMGDAGAFSFQGAKPLVAGEGGMFVTNSDEVYERARVLWMHGCSTTDRFWCTEIGLKYRMANVQAAVALGQFERVHSMVEAKREIFEWYREDLAGHPGISFHDQADWAFATHAVSSIMVDPGQGVDRDTVRGLLKERKIDTRQAFPPISQYPMWKTHEARPVAAEIGAKAINLPSGVRLTRAQVRYITQALWQITA